MGCLGGSGQTTDRKQTLAAYGNLDSLIGQLSSTGNNLTSAGASDTGQASNYYSNILSGNPSKIMAAAAPEVNAITAGAQQQQKQIAQTGNRTGGTNAISQGINTGVRGQIADTIGKLRSGAAAGEAGIGAGETAAGIGASSSAGNLASNLASISGTNRKTSQDIHTSAVNDWVKLISSIAGAIPSGGAGAAAGAGGGALDTGF
jgi:hypothetical protein